MSRVNRKYEICGLLTVPDLDINKVIEANDSVKIFFNNIDCFLQDGSSLANDISNPHVYTKKEELIRLMSDLQKLFLGIGLTELLLDIIRIEETINKGEFEQIKRLVTDLSEKIQRAIFLITDCKSSYEIEPEEEELLSEAVLLETKNDPPNILIVDDVTVVLNTVMSILKNKYEVFGLPKVTLVPKLLKTTSIDLFILDIEMPGMNGYELFSTIRRMPLYKDTPIMFFTSHVNVEYLTMAKEMGAAGYIKKPVKPVVLLEKVEACLTKAKAY